MESFKGKMLVRKSTLDNGEKVLILAGTFFPSASIDSFKDNDEMWVVELEVKEVIKFTGYIENNIQAPSPEEFISGEGQNSKDWKFKNGVNQHEQSK